MIAEQETTTDQAQRRFVPAVGRAAENLAYSGIDQLISKPTVRQARRAQRVVRAPGLLSEVYVRGYEHFPKRTDPAPIVALSHKKIHDVATIVELIAGRPREHFHDVTLIAQAGLFSAMYFYRDMVPAFCKRGFAAFLLSRPTVWLAHRLGGWMRRIFRDINAYPVYREGRDIPESEADFQNPLFADPLITGQSYADFIKFANRETRRSLMAVQQDMERDNRTFIILPEGGYLHDGSVAPLHDFLGFFAYRKQAPTIFGSLSYDELCPDWLGRIDAFVDLQAPTPPPADKSELTGFLARGRERMHAGTVLTASHLIACVAHSYRQSDADFSRAEFRARFFALCDAIGESRSQPAPAYDPGLASAQYRAERLRRFFRRSASRYFKRAGRGRLCVCPQKLQGFEDTERTVNDLEWNRNHVPDWLLADRSCQR